MCVPRCCVFGPLLSVRPLRSITIISAAILLFSAQQLNQIREIHHSAGNDNTWRDAAIIGTHLVDAVAIAVQRCTGMALQRSQWRGAGGGDGRWGGVRGGEGECACVCVRLSCRLAAERSMPPANKMSVRPLR